MVSVLPQLVLAESASSEISAHQSEHGVLRSIRRRSALAPAILEPPRHRAPPEPAACPQHGTGGVP